MVARRERNEFLVARERHLLLAVFVFFSSWQVKRLTCFSVRPVFVPDCDTAVRRATTEEKLWNGNSKQPTVGCRLRGLSLKTAALLQLAMSRWDDSQPFKSARERMVATFRSFLVFFSFHILSLSNGTSSERNGRSP